jgi:hypothetical protein
MKKLKSLSPEIEIIENSERINKEIALLCKKDISYIDMKLKISIGHERKGRLMIHLSKMRKNSIAKYVIMYIDDDSQFRDEAKGLFDRLMELLNGFCGTIGLESGPGDIFLIGELLTHMGDGEFYGIEHIKWNMNYRRQHL